MFEPVGWVIRRAFDMYKACVPRGSVLEHMASPVVPPGKKLNRHRCDICGSCLSTVINSVSASKTVLLSVCTWLCSFDKVAVASLIH